jgi:hypothetical protein
VITEAELAHWSQHVPWPELEQVEQDLVLSRLIVEIANHPLLGGELIFRGGTCLHKVWLDRPWRYSEDLDYVRRTAGGVGEILDALRDVTTAVGFDSVQTDVRRYPKTRLDTTFVRGGRMRIKTEMNTSERSPARPARYAPERSRTPQATFSRHSSGFASSHAFGAGASRPGTTSSSWPLCTSTIDVHHCR